MGEPAPVRLSAASSSVSSAPEDPQAYKDLCGKVDDRISSYEKKVGANDQKIRILKAFRHCLPRSGFANFGEDVLAMRTDEELQSMADYLYSALLIPMKAHGTTPAVTPSPRRELEADIDEIALQLEPSSRKDQKWLKAACLLRDGNRCMLTRIYDVEEAAKNLTQQELQRTATASTEVAHIIPLSIGKFNENEVDTYSQIWHCLYRCFPDARARVNLSPESINETCNAMTLLRDLHTSFGRFSFALEPTSTENQYRLKTYTRFPSLYTYYLPRDSIITFIAKDGRYPLPSRYLLDTHACIARILHMSGMWEYIEKVLRERENIRCLAADGSSDTQISLVR